MPTALKFGKWWHKGKGIDIAGLKGRKLMHRDTKGIYEELIAKSKAI